MWRTLLKLVAMKFIGHRLHLVVAQLLAFIERRAHIFIINMGDEWNRLLKTVIGFILVFTALVFSALIGAAWIVAIAWESPSRDLILGVSMLIPLLLVLVVAIYLRAIWHRKPYLESARNQLESDWQVLRGALSPRQPEAHDEAKPEPAQSNQRSTDQSHQATL